jgi:tripartite-type tricarboxylate transporter receptor subunit TctC
MPEPTRRQFATGAAAALLAPAAAPTAFAQRAWPDGQTVKVIVPFPPGGATNLVGRIVADKLAEAWRSPTVVENVPGAGTNLGNDRIAKGPADGSMMLIMSPPLVNNQFLFAKLSYDPEKDFIPLALVAMVPNLLCVRKDLPVDSVADLIAYAKGNPGKLNCASAGIGTSVHLSAELFKRMTGVEMAIVQYRGSGPALTDIVSGNVDLVFDNIGAIVSLARAGQVKALGITKLERSPVAPEYPPVADTIPGFETTSWTGVGVKEGTPREICDIIERDTLAFCRDQTVRERFAAVGIETVGMGAADFTKWLAGERVKWGKLITEQKIRVE